MHIGDSVRDAVRAVADRDKSASLRWTSRKRNGVRCTLDERIAHSVALALIATEEEELVFDDGSPHGGAELLQSPWSFRQSVRVEIVARIEDRVSIETVGRAMETVGARFQRHIDNGSGLAAVFRGRILQHVEFLDGVNRQDRRGISCNAGAVDDALAGEGFAVEKPVDDVCVVFRAETVCTRGGKSTAGVADHARAKL